MDQELEDKEAAIKKLNLKLQDREKRRKEANVTMVRVKEKFDKSKNKKEESNKLVKKLEKFHFK